MNPRQLHARPAPSAPMAPARLAFCSQPSLNLPHCGWREELAEHRGTEGCRGVASSMLLGWGLGTSLQWGTASWIVSSSGHQTYLHPYSRSRWRRKSKGHAAPRSPNGNGLLAPGARMLLGTLHSQPLPAGDKPPPRPSRDLGTPCGCTHPCPAALQGTVF